MYLTSELVYFLMALAYFVLWRYDLFLQYRIQQSAKVPQKDLVLVSLYTYAGQIFSYVCKYVMYVWMYVYVYACMYLCMCARVYVCIHKLLYI